MIQIPIKHAVKSSLCGDYELSCAKFTGCSWLTTLAVKEIVQ